MAYKPRANCKVCLFIRNESPQDPSKSKLYQLIQENLLGKRHLTDIHRAYDSDGLTYLNIRNHSLKHQGVTETRLARSKVKETEIQTARTERWKNKHHTENRGDLMEWLMSQIDEGHVKPTASAIVQLLKQQTDIEEKQKDRVHEMQKLFSSYVANPLPEIATRHIEYVEGEIVSDTPPSPQ